jgi:RNA polymerase sigma-70 factor, ECF subfamily
LSHDIRHDAEPPADSHMFDEQMAAARRGCRSSLGELLTAYRGYLLLVAHREVNDELRAKFAPSDLVQETFVRAQQAFANFRGDSDEQLRAWLHRILLNCHRTMRASFVQTGKRSLGSELRLDRIGAQDERCSPLAGDDSSISGAMAADEEGQRVIQLLDRLSEDYRQVVWLRNWEQMSFDDIGRRLGRSTDAVRKLWYRALAEFGQHWKQNGMEVPGIAQP